MTIRGQAVAVEDANGAVALAGRTNSCGVVVFEPLPDGRYSVRLDGEVADRANVEQWSR